MSCVGVFGTLLCLFFWIAYWIIKAIRAYPSEFAIGAAFLIFTLVPMWLFKGFLDIAHPNSFWLTTSLIMMALYYVFLWLAMNGATFRRIKKKFITGPFKYWKLSRKIVPVRNMAIENVSKMTPLQSELSAIEKELILEGECSYYKNLSARAAWRDRKIVEEMARLGVLKEDADYFEKFKEDLLGFSIFRTDSDDRIRRVRITKELVDKMNPTPENLEAYRIQLGMTEVEAYSPRALTEGKPHILCLWRNMMFDKLLFSGEVQIIFDREIEEEETV